ncbi:MAG: PKD domain-containing protein [Thermoplasmata archaeon]|nr:PKD domain-containing protein [Thermoplasmata archaeon]
MPDRPGWLSSRAPSSRNIRLPRSAALAVVGVVIFLMACPSLPHLGPTARWHPRVLAAVSSPGNALLAEARLSLEDHSAGPTALASRPGSLGPPAWNVVTASGTGPPPRRDMGMTYDAADGYVVMFGGDGAALYNETWIFRNDTWSEIFPAISPHALGGAGLVYDARDGYVLMFGGQRDGNQVCNETWKFVGGQWTELFPTVSPPARQFGSTGMTYDAADRYVLLYGGNDNDLVTYGDTWSYAAGVWTNRSALTGMTPGERITSITYDAADGYVVLFGGSIGSVGWANDTWTYLNGTWTERFPALSPPPRWPAPITYDAADGYVLLFGSIGPNGGNGYQNDTWEFRAGNWTNATATVAPGGRWVSAMTYDSSLGSVLLYGGYQQPYNLGDTWLFSGGNWTSWVSTSSSYPASRSGPAMAHDSAAGYVLMFGGRGSAGPLNETWTYSAGTWTPLALSVVPPARSGAAMTYDSTDHYILLFGGSGASGALNDTWRFSNGSWTKLSPLNGHAPPARWGAALADDPTDGYTLLFGGSTPSDLGDTWAYAGGAWTQLAASLGPSARSGSAMAFDPAIGTVVLFGGTATSATPPTFTQYGDTWSFGGGNWSRLNLSSAPSPRDGSGFAYLPSAGALILYGGFVGSSGNLSAESWEFQGARWTLLSPIQNPGPASHFGFAWESTSGNLAFFGPPGTGGSAPPTWQFSYAVSNNSSGYPAAPLRVSAKVLSVPTHRPNEVQLVAEVSGGRLPYSLQWMFGDGSQGSARPNQVLAHAYPSSGEFLAVLVVTDGAGNINRTTTIVQAGSVTGTGAGTGTSLNSSSDPGWALLAVAVAVVGPTMFWLGRRRARERARREGEILRRELQAPGGVNELP